MLRFDSALFACHHPRHHCAKFGDSNAFYVVLGNIVLLKIFECRFDIANRLLAKLIRMPSMVFQVGGRKAKIDVVPIGKSL